MKQLLIASTSTLHGGNYLDYLTEELKVFFFNCSKLIFIPYARPGGILHDAYTEKAAGFFKTLNIEVIGLHTYENPQEAITNTEGIFVGGGNTFVLVNQLHKLKLMETLRAAVLTGTPYLGTSAGSNICGLTMQTTNDMPIILPSSFKTLGLVPFNINPHYLDPDTTSKHMGETRETRIKEFHTLNPQPVVGLREGSWLHVEGENITLKGALNARIFEKDKVAYEVTTGSSLTGLK